MGYNIIALEDMYEAMNKDEKKIKEKLCDFECDLNKDVEYFIRECAIESFKASISKTFLVLASYKEKQVIVGYFSLTIKTINVKKKYLSKTMIKRIRKFAKNNEYSKHFTLSIPLIGQLGKNYKDGYKDLISGDELLKIACNKVKEAQKIISGKLVYIECEDKECLKNFYESNGFVYFGKRNLDKDERDKNSGQYLLQMLCYLK